MKTEKNRVFIYQFVFVMAIMICASFYVAPIYADTATDTAPTLENPSHKETKADLKELRELISRQEEMIRNLKLDIKSQSDKPPTNGITFIMWIGILLAGVTASVTSLGVLIALLTFFGYRDILKQATQTASSVASEHAKDEFEKFITKKEDGLKSLIKKAIDEVLYRNTEFGNDESENVLKSEEQNS